MTLTRAVTTVVALATTVLALSSITHAESNKRRGLPAEYYTTGYTNPSGCFEGACRADNSNRLTQPCPDGPCYKPRRTIKRNKPSEITGSGGLTIR
jgi:hypothetical protein